MNGFQKISPVFNDVIVSRIECFGPNIPLMAIRAGKKTKTTITLSKPEIEDIFKHFADKSNVPLIEGPIKLEVENVHFEGPYNIDRTLSFKIIKQTAYSMLERKRSQPRRMPQRRINK